MNSEIIEFPKFLHGSVRIKPRDPRNGPPRKHRPGSRGKTKRILGDKVNVGKLRRVLVCVYNNPKIGIEACLKKTAGWAMLIAEIVRGKPLLFISPSFVGDIDEAKTRKVVQSTFQKRAKLRGGAAKGEWTESFKARRMENMIGQIRALPIDGNLRQKLYAHKLVKAGGFGVAVMKSLNIDIGPINAALAEILPDALNHTVAKRPPPPRRALKFELKR